MWYSVSLFFKGSHLTRPHIKPLWEERIILIDAGSEEEAQSKAIIIGKKEEHEYEAYDAGESEAPGIIKWTFEQVESVCQIDDDTLSNGAELFSRFISDFQAISVLSPIPDDFDIK